MHESLPNHDPSTWPPLESPPKATTTIDPQNSSPKVTRETDSRLPIHISTLKYLELLMMINNRPESQAELYLVVVDVEARMNEKEQGEVLDCVKKCFGGQWGDEAVEGRSIGRGGV
ncbi:hypothetical protein L211DRAFT_693537 [Terfezia boudieri ATCC MYA-4762]|uniref:Uncharacterized protein n=1 Tax=Terfezia boudieri ATCC MYA-4762 TaxID=1051890 RepID=A0A3N4LTG0_9PEZI|nr:hypothetical protein L211DRAFT_693537 [Terfezia boudieri ATCC MYA-4762]